ncbi:MAG: hypothetical protein HN576_12760 [Bacteriovoracaceae bacterium]|nr:hypothetical protein [Bacteriovoracaceae bacterium]
MTEKKHAIIIYPTDTVWGIGASIFDNISNRLIRSIKKNEQSKPLSILFQSYDQFKRNINIPSELKIDLLSIYSLGATALVPISWIVGEISPEIYLSSKFVGARIASNELQVKLCKLTNDPITTTSLNLKNEEPILTEADALDFQNKYIINSSFISSLESPPSGIPSTVIMFESNLKMKIIREGSNCLEIEHSLGL